MDSRYLNQTETIEFKKINHKKSIEESLELDFEDIFQDMIPVVEDEEPGENKEIRFTKMLEEFEERLQCLIGGEDFKKEMRSLAAYSRNSVNINNNPSKDGFFPVHYIFTIDSAMGLTTMLKILSSNLYSLGITKAKSMIEYQGSLSFDFKCDIGSPDGVFLKDDGGNIRIDSDYGVIAVNITKQLEDPDFNFNMLMEVAYRERGKTVFVFVAEKKDSKKVINRIQSRVNCRHIDFPEYTTGEFTAIGIKMLQNFGFNVTSGAEKKLFGIVEEVKKASDFRNIKTVAKIVEAARIHKMFQRGSSANIVIEAKDFEATYDYGMDVKDSDDFVSAWQELDEIIGLEKIKEKIKEIAANAKVQMMMKDIGARKKDMSYHMVFTGNPGTGKTTVARILGRLFKELGILKIGDTYEVGREGLVGRFVGHTAPKVRDKVQEAIGSVLFIDEAYSLYTEGDKIDYGHEAIETLTKLMEDRRHELIVILAGYPKEMEKLLNMNPGLKERIPYRVDFPNYTPMELRDIFIKELGKEFVLGEGVYEAILEIFEKAAANGGDNFANGRIARNIAERLEIKHSLRVYNSKITEKLNLMTITMEDIRALYSDEDVMCSLLGEQGGPGKMGFI